MKHQRIQGDALQLPQAHYRHVEHDSRVVLLGMMHVAPLEFYQDVQETVDGMTLSGATMYLEGILPSKDRRNVRKERAISKALLGIYGIFEEMGIAHFVYQKPTMKYGDNVVLNDVTSDVIMPVLKPFRIRLILGWLRFLVGTIKRLGGDPREVVEKTYFEEKEEKETWVTRFIGMDKEIIVDLRNEHALKFTENGEPHDDAVLLWGAAHIPGMHEILLSRGYVSDGLHWRTVLTKADLA